MKMADKEGGETFDEAVEERVINEEYKVRYTSNVGYFLENDFWTKFNLPLKIFLDF